MSRRVPPRTSSCPTSYGARSFVATTPLATDGLALALLDGVVESSLLVSFHPVFLS